MLFVCLNDFLIHVSVYRYNMWKVRFFKIFMLNASIYVQEIMRSGYNTYVTLFCTLFHILLYCRGICIVKGENLWRRYNEKYQKSLQISVNYKTVLSNKPNQTI